MERGTEREREAVRARWTELERQRRLGTRLGVGLSAGYFGVLLILLSLPSEACVGDGGVPPYCSSVSNAIPDIWVAMTGGIVLASGVWLCWSSLRS